MTVFKQIRDLKAAGAEKLFRENVSSVAPHKQLEAAIEFAREGDTLVVTKIDRLARSVRHLCEIVDRLRAKGVALRILNMNLDTNDATGKLMLQIIGSVRLGCLPLQPALLRADRIVKVATIFFPRSPIGSLGSCPLKDRPAPHFDFCAIITFVIARSKCGGHDNSPLTPLHVPPVILLVASLLWFGFCPSHRLQRFPGLMSRA